jgi:hypothetical protein
VNDVFDVLRECVRLSSQSDDAIDRVVVEQNVDDEADIRSPRNSIQVSSLFARIDASRRRTRYATLITIKDISQSERHLMVDKESLQELCDILQRIGQERH